MIAKRFSQKEKRFFFAPNEGLRRMESIDWKAGWNRFPGLGRFCKPASLFFSDADLPHALGAFPLGASIEWLSARRAQKTSRMMRAMIRLGLSMFFR